jgi:hypothetical protein
MTEFITALHYSDTSELESRLSTGSPELDCLIDNIKPSLFYLFYGEKNLVEILFRYLTTNALKPNNKGLPVVVYMLLGNYRRERTNLGMEELAELVEDSGFHMWEAMKRIQIFTASSADQQTLLVRELLKFLAQEDNVSLVLVRGIYKLAKDDARVRNRHVVWEEVQRSMTKLSQICARRSIPLVASGREVRFRGKTIPHPESSCFLRHLANVIIYLRKRQKDSKYNRAFLVDHPTKAQSSVEYGFVVNEKLGRETKPFRQSFQELVERLRREFQEPLVSKKRKTAFDLLLESWSSELGAMSFAESFKMLDLMLLVSSIENRRLIEDLKNKQNVQHIKIKKLVERLE